MIVGDFFYLLFIVCCLHINDADFLATKALGHQVTQSIHFQIAVTTHH